MATAIGSVTALPRHSDEYLRVEHLLQLSCRSTAVKDVTVWSVNNPHLSVQFERKGQALLQLDSWVDVNGLDDSNAVQDVCKRGFQLPESGEGMVFPTGNIRFDPDSPGEGRDAKSARKAWPYDLVQL